MSHEAENPTGPEFPQDPHEPYHQQIQHQSISARLPESLGEGVFCTSSLIVESNDMFLIDFVNGSAPPARLAARVILTPATMQQFLAALTQSCETARGARRVERSGEGGASVGGGTPASSVPIPPPETPAQVSSAKVASGGKASGSAPQAQRSVEDIYGELKFTDDLLCGAFANTVIIRHSADEVVFDFISNYFPRAVVTCRVAMATSRVERFRRSVEDAFRKYQEKRQGH